MYYYLPRGGKRIPLGHDFAQAMMAYAKLVDRPRVLHTLGDLFDRYQIEVLPSKAPRTQRDNLIELGRLRDAMGHFPAQSLTAQHVYQYMDTRGAPVRANREKALLSHVCNYGVRWGVLTANPCKGVVRNTERPRDRCPSQEELDMFKKAADNDMIRLYVDFKYMTAMRKGDILRLRLDQMTLDGIRFLESKKGRRRLVRWSLELRELVTQIRALPRKIGTMSLFAQRKGQPYTETGFDSIWQRAMRRYVKAGGVRFHEHDIRASSATASPETAAKRLGDTPGQTAAYLRQVGEDAYNPIPLRRTG
jgi:integrase